MPAIDFGAVLRKNAGNDGPIQQNLGSRLRLAFAIAAVAKCLSYPPSAVSPEDHSAWREPAKLKIGAQFAQVRRPVAGVL